MASIPIPSLLLAFLALPYASEPDDPDYFIQGEYAGVHSKDGKRVGARISAQGGGHFKGVLYEGGLAGDG